MKIYVQSSQSIPNITSKLSRFAYDGNNPLDVTCKEWMGPGEMSYHKLCKTVHDAETYNYHSDYWGNAEDYQEANIEIMDAFESLVGRQVQVDFEDDEPLIGTLEGILIDKQYNSTSHTKVLLSGIQE